MRRSVLLSVLGAVLIVLGLATAGARGMWPEDDIWRMGLGLASLGAVSGGAWVVAHARADREEESGEEA